MKTGGLKLTLKNVAGLDTTDGTVTVSVLTPLGDGTATVPTKAIGKGGKTFKLVRTKGTVAP